jgi:hypothetical protein
MVKGKIPLHVKKRSINNSRKNSGAKVYCQKIRGRQAPVNQFGDLLLQAAASPCNGGVIKEIILRHGVIHLLGMKCTTMAWRQLLQTAYRRHSNRGRPWIGRCCRSSKWGRREEWPSPPHHGWPSIADRALFVGGWRILHIWAHNINPLSPSLGHIVRLDQN